MLRNDPLPSYYDLFMETVAGANGRIIYRQVSNISRTLVGD